MMKFLLQICLASSLLLSGCEHASPEVSSAGVYLERSDESDFDYIPVDSYPQKADASGEVNYGGYGSGSGYGGGYGGGGDSTNGTSSSPGIRFTQAEAPQLETSANPSSSTQTRKLIYNTTMQVVVEELDDALAKLDSFITKNGGFVASNDQNTATQNARNGVWTIRVPINNYESILRELKSLGHVEKLAEKTQDVTEEYIDIEARLENSKMLEERIIKLLEDRSGKLSDILEIERELARVRETIERIEGQLRYLSNKTSLATIAVSIREQKEYMPPEPLTYASRTSAAWDNSVQNVKEFISQQSIQVVSIVPWLSVIVPVALTVWIIFRRLFRRASNRVTATAGNP